MTKNEIREIARAVADELDVRWGSRMHRSPNGNLTIEVVEINTLPTSLRGGMAHD
ncbi:hypothetical protein S101447_00936 [Acetobacter ascendens]|uniref:Uncharacterized protein n=1 Tax=Acetobacter ascendens TaxID=481146 RepID=A0A1Y0V2W5_9PROT|nr:hypothetical protein S101447_00936 [Acetobacter ascendens]